MTVPRGTSATFYTRLPSCKFNFFSSSFLIVLFLSGSARKMTAKKMKQTIGIFMYIVVAFALASEMSDGYQKFT